jgi:hypothetical protein
MSKVPETLGDLPLYVLLGIPLNFENLLKMKRQRLREARVRTDVGPTKCTAEEIAHRTRAQAGKPGKTRLCRFILRFYLIKLLSGRQPNS